VTLELSLHSNLTKKQRDVLKCKSPYIVLDGLAGTSKTYLALARGLKLLRDNEVGQIVIIRSAVEIRAIGHLPGDKEEKLDAYTEPYVHLVGQLSPKKGFKALMKAGDIEFHSTSFLRGVTFDHTCIIMDEFQNCNAHELETIITRVGEGTHLILCGDSDQTDLRFNEAKEHHAIIDTLRRMDDFVFFQFGLSDIVRSEFVKRYYEAKLASASGESVEWLKK
jgi:phosphate starvation-inducible protein PhoH